MTLLRVGTPDGRRVHSGEAITVARGDLCHLESAENPDGIRPPVPRSARRSRRSTGPSGRSVGCREAVPAALATAGLGGGVAGADSEVAFGAMIPVGSLALAHVGSGRR